MSAKSKDINLDKLGGKTLEDRGLPPIRQSKPMPVVKPPKKEATKK